MMMYPTLRAVLACLLISAGACLIHPLKAQKMDSVSYSLGLLVAGNLQSQGFDALDAESLAKGMADVLSGGDTHWDAATANQIIQDYVENKEKSKYTDIVAEAEAFFKENARKEGITTTASGLQYEVLHAGEGASPKLTDKVTTHYHGTLLNGEVFDSSVDRGQPATFPVNGVIAGWTEALQMMKVGDKWRLYVPSELAYGSRGAGAKIGPFTPLIFEVELLSIQD
jgi:FKBP-type peptidyl-prolyl cis-trans isomerase FklB